MSTTEKIQIRLSVINIALSIAPKGTSPEDVLAIAKELEAWIMAE